MSHARLALYLAVIFAAFCVTGAIDLAEEERFNLQGYVDEHLELAAAALEECR
jgi:hypothetical protein